MPLVSKQRTVFFIRFQKQKKLYRALRPVLQQKYYNNFEPFCPLLYKYAPIQKESCPINRHPAHWVAATMGRRAAWLARRGAAHAL